ncbi:hypothetical protein QTP88_016634 [Uroleucon formosanum]
MSDILHIVYDIIFTSNKNDKFNINHYLNIYLFYTESDSDDEEFTDINDRLNGIDLNDAEVVWSYLTDSEKAEFEHLVKSGDISKILPQFTPWWCLPIEKQIVTEVGETMNDSEFPPLITNIPKLSILSKKSPSDCIQWNLVNMITPYVFLIRYYNGKHKSYLSEFINGLYNLSKNLCLNQNFESYDMAVKSVELGIQEHEMFKGFQEGFILINNDLETIFSSGLDSNCNYYIKLALSDIHNLLTIYKNEQKNISLKKTEQGEFNRKFPDAKATYSIHVDIKKVRLLLKKIEYFLSWVDEIDYITVLFALLFLILFVLRVSSSIMGSDEPEQYRKLFIGGLNYTTTNDSLKEFFEQWGEIVDVVVMKDPQTKRSRGFGFITYSQSSMVDQAMSNRPHKIDGREVETKRAVPRDDIDKPDIAATVKKMFVSGIKEQSENDLLEYFGKFGNITNVTIVTDKDSGQRKGFGFIEYDDTDSVDKAVLIKSHQVAGGKLDVKKAISRSDGAGGGRGGPMRSNYTSNNRTTPYGNPGRAGNVNAGNAGYGQNPGRRY